MSQKNLYFMLIVATSLFVIVQMYSIKSSSDGLRRFQRGFGNRRDLINTLIHHYPKEALLGLNSQDYVSSDKYLFSNPYDTIDQTDLTQEQQSPTSMNYR